MQWVTGDLFHAAYRIKSSLAPIYQRSEFSSRLERLVIIEGGGHNAVGARIFDLGEVYLFDGLAQVIYGVGLLLGSDPSILDKPRDNWSQLSRSLLTHRWKSTRGVTDGLRAITQGLDAIANGLRLIDKEVSDQSEHFIPNNLVRLEGTFSIPGVLVETDVKELVMSLGIDEQTLDKLNAPKGLIMIVRLVSGTLKVVRTLVHVTRSVNS
jgi:hypothetical protein